MTKQEWATFFDLLTKIVSLEERFLKKRNMVLEQAKKHEADSFLEELIGLVVR